MLGHHNKDDSDGKSNLSPLMSLFRKIKPKRRHRSVGPDSPESQRQRKLGERPRNGKRNSQASSVGSDLSVDSEVAYVLEAKLTSAPRSYDMPKPPGNEEIVSLVSEKSTQGDGMLRVTSDQWESKGRQGEVFFKVDCKGRYGDPGTKFLWGKPKPIVGEHEYCLGAYLGAIDPCKKSSTEGQYPLRLCCHKMMDGKIHLAAHKVPTGTQDTEGLLYVCKDKERSGVITLQENASHSDKPLAGLFIGTTNDGNLQMFPHNQFEPYTANPFVNFYLMDLDEGKTESLKRMNGEK